MTAKIIVTLAVVLLASRCDALRDRHFDPERLTRGRLPIRALGGTDLFHLVKWASFYPPLALCCYLGYGPPWSSWPVSGLWVGTVVASWALWSWGSPWPSFWTRIFRR